MTDFMVVTNDGVRVADGTANGMSADAAKATAADRNRTAESMGLKTRYQVVAFVRPVLDPDKEKAA